MFDVAPSELLILGTVALLVIPPKDLPKAMHFAGKWVGRARNVARQFRSGFDEMIREAELSELQRQWAEENARIMREHPMPSLENAAPPLPPSVEDGAHMVDAAPPVMVARPTMVDAPAAPPVTTATPETAAGLEVERDQTGKSFPTQAPPAA